MGFMGISIVTFADLGKKQNLKTVDITPVINTFIKKQQLDTIVCRINNGYFFPETYSMISRWWHYILTLLGMVSRGFINARAIEERVCDMVATSFIYNTDIVLFHPEYFFQKSVHIIKNKGIITIGIATMAHIALNATLEKQEQELLGLPYTDNFYQGLLDKNGDMPDFDYLIAVSDFVKTSYIEHGFPAEKIFVAPLDSVLTISSIHAQPLKKFRVVYTAHTNMLKGLHYLLDAWKQITIPNKELIIIGQIKKNPKKLFKQYQDSITHDPTIIWTGQISREEIVDYYKTASVFVLPSLTEGNPRVVLEAMAMGIPVITTTNAPSLVCDGISGFIVPIRDSATIIEKLMYLYTHPEIRTHMGIEARRTIENKKSFGESVFEIYEIIRKKHNL